MAVAGVDAGGHAQRDRRRRSSRPRRSSIVHCMSEAAPQARSDVPVAVEEQQQRVAAELEHVAAVPLGDVDQLGEDARDARDELLGAAPPGTRAAPRAP